MEKPPMVATRESSTFRNMEKKKKSKTECEAKESGLSLGLKLLSEEQYTN